MVAEGEASTLADVLIDRIGGGATINPFVGEIKCYIEMGDDTVGLVNVNFLSGPAPTAVLTPPSLQGAEEKREFAASRRRRWFG